jgi:ketosteroid isomerase-like protein
MTNKNQVMVVVNNWALAVRNGDIDKILKHHDKNMVMFDVPYPLQCKGIEEYKKTWDTYFSWSRSGVFDIVEMEVTADDELAFCYGLMRCTGTSMEGVNEDLTFRLTVCLKKIDGEWIICHEHHSLPSL